MADLIVDLKTFITEVRTISVRNLIGTQGYLETEGHHHTVQPTLFLHSRTPSRPGSSEEGKILLYSSDFIQYGNNPSWCIPGLLARAAFIPDNETVLYLQILDGRAKGQQQDHGQRLLDLCIDVRTLVFIGSVRLSYFANLPLNSVFFSTDGGYFVSGELQSFLRESGYISLEAATNPRSGGASVGGGQGGSNSGSASSGIDVDAFAAGITAGFNALANAIIAGVAEGSSGSNVVQEQPQSLSTVEHAAVSTRAVASTVADGEDTFNSTSTNNGNEDTDQIRLKLAVPGVAGGETSHEKEHGNSDDDDDDDYEEEEKRRARIISSTSEKIRTTAATVEELRARASEMIRNATERSAAIDDRVKRMTLEELRKQVESAEQDADLEEAALAQDLQLLANKSDIVAAIQRCEELVEEINLANKNARTMREELQTSQYLLEARQTKLLKELQSIYPIIVLDTGEYTIRGVELPPLNDLYQRDDELVSTALGYTVHLLVLMSKYLNIPLRYQLIFYGSRSMIFDPIIGNNGVTLPLYKRGVERERFERAVVWLEKNVQQLLATKGLKYETREELLFNINKIFRCETCHKLAI